MENSEELNKRLQSGDHKAFEVLFHALYPQVKAFIKTIVKTEDTAEDLTQQLFVDLWVNHANIIPEKNLRAYIYTMARNNAITALKQQTRFEVTENVREEEIDSTLTDDILMAKETALVIHHTVEAMPAKRKRVYEMSRYENKSNEEIAKELNISRKVVEKHLRLAINELRRVLMI